MMNEYRRMSKDDYYLAIALAVSRRSTCLKRHYGCVIVKNDEIIATGYNGSPRGMINCCDRGFCKRANAQRYSGYENCDSVHAEQNAMLSASRRDMIGATIYLACETYTLDKELSAKYGEDTYAWQEDSNPVPCSLCARMIANSGIEFVKNRKSVLNSGVINLSDILEKREVQCCQ